VRAKMRAQREETERRVQQTARLSSGCRLIAEVALVVRGFRRHKRGQWRRKRVS
jgi:uncharacterized membrane protein